MSKVDFISISWGSWLVYVSLEIDFRGEDPLDWSLSVESLHLFRMEEEEGE